MGFIIFVSCCDAYSNSTFVKIQANINSTWSRVVVSFEDGKASLRHIADSQGKDQTHHP